MFFLEINIALVQLSVWIARFWGQNDKNSRNFGVTTDTVIITGIYATHVRGNFIIKKVAFVECELTELDN